MAESSNTDNLFALKEYHGRYKITLPMSKDEFTKGGEQGTIKNIIDSLPYVLNAHNKNAQAIDYLYKYYKGIQPILEKKKVIREDINHIVLENHAFEIVEFKKSFLYGDPIQYVQKGNKNDKKLAEKIVKLNEYCEMTGKANEDKQIAEWQYICGTAYRYVDQNPTYKDYDEAPFKTSAPDPRSTFVVYSNSIKQEVLFSGFIRNKDESLDSLSLALNPNGTKVVLSIYTDDFYMEIVGEEIFGEKPSFSILQQVLPLGNRIATRDTYPLQIKGNRIIEYPLNNSRLGLIELVQSILDAINQIKSNDVDDIDQFVQSLIVFINQQVDVEEFKKLLEAGAIEVNTDDATKPADVKQLVASLKHSDTKVVTDDLYEKALTICGIPRLTDNSGGGDTGTAASISGGWTMATERAKQDIVSFKNADTAAQKLIIRILQYFEKKDFRKLSANDLALRFNFNTSTNLLVKTQGLMNMKSAQVAPIDAFEKSGIFADSLEAYNRAVDYYGKNFWGAETEKKEEPADTDEDTEKDMPRNITYSDDPDQYDSTNLPDKTKTQK